MKKIIIVFSFILTAHFVFNFALEDALANKASSEVLAGYELVCELVEMDNGATEWSCQVVPVTVGFEATIAGTGGGGTITRLYLVCWEHHANGRPTGQTLAVMVSTI